MTEQTPQNLNLSAMDFANDDVREEGTKAISYLTSRLQEAQSNPRLCAILQEQMQTRSLIPQVQQERASSLERGNRQQEKTLIKIKGLLPSREEDLMQGKLLRHKEEGVVMIQMVGRSFMGNPMKMCQQDATHNIPQIALEREDAVARAIALLHQVETKEDTQETREGVH